MYLDHGITEGGILHCTVNNDADYITEKKQNICTLAQFQREGTLYIAMSILV
jgi:hypothetical protein